jgi:hypothetical protein
VDPTILMIADCETRTEHIKEAMFKYSNDGNFDAA